MSTDYNVSLEEAKFYLYCLRGDSCKDLEEHFPGLKPKQRVVISSQLKALMLEVVFGFKKTYNVLKQIFTLKEINFLQASVIRVSDANGVIRARKNPATSGALGTQRKYAGEASYLIGESGTPEDLVRTIYENGLPVEVRKGPKDEVFR